MTNSTVIQSLRALESQVRGDARPNDYLYLLSCLAYLRSQDQNGWAQLAPMMSTVGDPGSARRLLRLVTTVVDSSLGYPNWLGDSTAPPARLRPAAVEPVLEDFRLAARLTSEDCARLRSDFLRGTRGRDDKIYTPSSIARVMVSLVDGSEAYDPYARFGELLAEFARAKHGSPVRVRAVNGSLTELRLAGMWLAETGAQVELATTTNVEPKKATVVLTNPPFGKHGEFDSLEHAIASLAENGRAAVLMPYSAGFDAGTRASGVRQDLVERGAVIAVVGLPARLFPQTSIGVCVWLLRRPTGQATQVRFVDATRMGRPSGASGRDVQVLDPADIKVIVQAVTATEQKGISATASPDAIRQNGYSLHPPEYQEPAPTYEASNAARAELDVLFTGLEAAPVYTTGLDEGWIQRPLRELCDIRTGVPHKPLRAALARAQPTKETMPVVCPRHLREGRILANDVELADVVGQDRYKLIAGDVLWIRTGAMGEVAMVRPEEAGWLPHTNLLRLRIRQPSELDPAYLLSYLAQSAVQERIRRRSIKSVTTSLSTKTLGELEIPVPPPTHQRRILAALQALDKQTHALEERLTAVREARAQLGRHLTKGTVVLTGEEPA